MADKLDDVILQEFMHGFYGYGNYNAPFWFVGMEEGGGNSIEEINSRLQTWKKRGRREIEDVVAYHREFGISKYWEEKPPLEATWNKIIRIYLAANGSIPTTDEVRFYQRDHLGREKQETCLLELLPLPSPSTNHWLYADGSHIPALVSRQSYRDWLIPIRIKRLQDRIQTYRPLFVILYGKTYLEHWKAISDAPLLYIDTLDIYSAELNGTLYVVTNHPVATGVSNEYFHNIGRMLAEEV
jgi:hypothetical protein